MQAWSLLSRLEPGATWAVLLGPNVDLGLGQGFQVLERKNVDK